MIASTGIHRLIEQQAAMRGNELAFNDDSRILTYRELNGRANIVARGLVASGFKRGAVAALNMPRSAELAITMLAVLKAGGAYMNVERDAAGWPAGVSIVQRDGESPALALDLRRLLSNPIACGPNLPIVTRPSDLACVLLGRDGARPVLVSHATVTALQPWNAAPDIYWSEESGAFDLWLALMNGATVTSATTAPQLAA